MTSVGRTGAGGRLRRLEDDVPTMAALLAFALSPVVQTKSKSIGKDSPKRALGAIARATL